MAVPTRGIKTSAGGGTAFVANTDILAAEANTDFDNIYNEMDNIDNTNVAASGDIALTKLADTSSTDAAHSATTAPGDSTSHTKPTNLEAEIQQLRYVIERLALGNDAGITTGATETFWGDVPARGPNLIVNGSFEGGRSAASLPNGWSIVGAPTLTLPTTDVSEGKGEALNVVEGAAAQQGVSQTLSGIKASTRYLVSARVKVASGDAHLETTGASGTFGDLDLTTDSASFTTLKGVIETDATPTNIVVLLHTSGTGTDDVTWDHVSVRECSTEVGLVEASAYPTARTTFTDVTNPANTGAAWTTVTGCTTAVTLPAHNFEIEVELHVHIGDAANGGESMALQLLENGTAVETTWASCVAQGHGAARLNCRRKSLTAGTTYTYTARATQTNVTGGQININAAVAGNIFDETLQSYIEARLIRVS